MVAKGDDPTKTGVGVLAEGARLHLTFQRQKPGTRPGFKLRHHAGLADTSFDVQCGMIGASI
jgi:hypothetical protein